MYISTNYTLVILILYAKAFNVEDIDIKLDPEVPPLLSPIGRSLNLHVHLGPIEVLVEMKMSRLDCEVQ